jgi:hypothetical protein
LVPLTCMLEGSPGIFAGSLLVEVGAQVARPAGARSAWSGLLRRQPGVPVGGISSDSAGVLSPRPRTRPPNKTGSLIEPLSLGRAGFCSHRGMVQERKSGHQCFPKGNAAEVEAPLCPRRLQGCPLSGLNSELGQPDIGGGGASEAGLGSIKSGRHHDD